VDGYEDGYADAHKRGYDDGYAVDSLYIALVEDSIMRLYQ
jgi:hypothetical protein